MVKHFTKILLYAPWNNRELMNYWKQRMSPLVQIRDWSGKQLISRTFSFFSPLSSHGYTWSHRRSRPSRVCEQKWSANPSKQLKNNAFFYYFLLARLENFPSAWYYSSASRECSKVNAEWVMHELDVEMGNGAGSQKNLGTCISEPFPFSSLLSICPGKSVLASLSSNLGRTIHFRYYSFGGQVSPTRVFLCGWKMPFQQHCGVMALVSKEDVLLLAWRTCSLGG